MPTSTKVEGDTPAGRSTTRFSTLPSLPTTTATAWRGDNGTKASCLSTGSSLGTSTIPAQADRPDKAAVALLIASSIGPPRSISASIAARSSARGSATCMIASTNSLRPVSVGIRPAEVCGWLSSPSSSRSCMTLRIEADDRLRCEVREMVREPTGWPESR